MKKATTGQGVAEGAVQGSTTFIVAPRTTRCYSSKADATVQHDR